MREIGAVFIQGENEMKITTVKFLADPKLNIKFNFGIIFSDGSEIERMFRGGFGFWMGYGSWIKSTVPIFVDESVQIK